MNVLNIQKPFLYNKIVANLAINLKIIFYIPQGKQAFRFLHLVTKKGLITFQLQNLLTWGNNIRKPSGILLDS